MGFGLSFGGLEFGLGDGFVADAFESVEGGDFVGFGEGGVVEYGVDEVGDGAVIGHDSLADVDEFGGGFADDVYAQEFSGGLVEDEFEHTCFVSGDGASGDFAETSDTYFVGDAFFGEFLFGFSNDGDFRDGVDAVGEELGVDAVGYAQGVAGGLASLFHGGGGQGGESDDVACGVDVGLGGLEIFVDGDDVALT